MPATPAVFDGSAAYTAPSPGPVVTIGNFDGVHRGHQALVATAVAQARDAGCPSVALTFSPMPREVLAPDRPVARLQTTEDRVAALGALGVDHVVIERFDPEMSMREPDWFAHTVLEQRLQASAIVVGWNFRFGRERTGDAGTLSTLLATPVTPVQPVQVDGEPVSSSRIRGALGRGNVSLAARLLGRHHLVHGEVVHGHHRGRKLGFPTANVAAAGIATPANGVYAVTLDGTGDSHGGVANIGVRPTFDAGPRSLEVHLLDFEGDLYGQRVTVNFVQRIRGERRFDDPSSLMRQITADIAAARVALAAVR